MITKFLYKGHEFQVVPIEGNDEEFNIVSVEMVDAYINDKLPWMDDTDRLRMKQGIAVYTHLQSPGSEEWRMEHGFKTED